MKLDETLQKDTEAAIKWEPSLYDTAVSVTVKNGVATLSGTVDSYAKKTAAEKAAQSVTGVKAVVRDIKIRLDSSTYKIDTEINGHITTALRSNWQVADDKVKVTVENGWVTLEGELKWNYQKEAAENSVADLMGVNGITNNISIRSDRTDRIEQKDIELALARNWATNNRDIKVMVTENRVRLYGTAYSIYQKSEAGRIAWGAPGIGAVDNELEIGYDM